MPMLAKNTEGGYRSNQNNGCTTQPPTQVGSLNSSLFPRLPLKMEWQDS